jgi:peptidoglycan/LPS O-acetylase OafA/YrhL
MRGRHENHALNAVRAGAAIVVVIVHARAFLLQSRQDFDPGRATQVAYALTSFGHGAVLVFFVLSGYFVGGSVITGRRRGSFDWRRYTVSRLTRLWIVLIPALVLTLILDAVGSWLAPAFYLYRDGVGSPVEFAGNAVFLQGMYVAPFGSNGALWSLAYEAFYYALFPLLVLGMTRTKGPGRWGFVLAAAVVIAVGGIPIWLLFPVWLLGAVVAWQEPWLRRGLATWSRRRTWSARSVVFAGLAGALVADRATEGGAASVSWAGYAVGVFTAALVVLLLGDLHPRRRVGRAALLGLSRYAHSSYSLYAIHMPLLALVVAVINPVSDRADLWTPSPLAWLTVALVVGLLVAAGWLFARATERHTDAVRDQLLRVSGAMAPAAGLRPPGPRPPH